MHYLTQEQQQLSEGTSKGKELAGVFKTTIQTTEEDTSLQCQTHVRHNS
jgi:hypothetical protein